MPLHIDGRFLLGDQQHSADNDGERRDRDDGGGDVQGRSGRKMLHQLAADDGGSHGGDVEPQPLLIDEGPALVEPLAVLDQDAAAQRARYRHGVGGEHQRDGEVARRGQSA